MIIEKGAILIREDGIKFKVLWLGHWSTVMSDNGELDDIKFYGTSKDGEMFISASKGFKYTLPND